METVWIILCVLLLLLGVIGSFLPFLPGPPLAYAALLLHQYTGGYPFSARFLIIWAAITVIVMLLENIIPAWGTERFGGSRYGIFGCVGGLIIGIIFFPPFGIVLGPLIGAFVGELLGGQPSDQAWRSAVGSFVGFLVGSLLKFIAVALMGYYFAASIL